MKFGLLAFIAQASAIKINTLNDVCIPPSESDEIFHMIDTNHNHVLNPPELYTAIRYYVEKTHMHLTEENIHWIEETAAKDAATNGKDGTMDKKEFWYFIN